MTTIKLRRGTATQWTTADPVLAAGEPGLTTDGGLLKFGDGTTPWSTLHDPVAMTRRPDGSQVTIQKGASSYLNWMVDGTGAGYGIHVTSAPNYAGSGLIGVGNDFGTGPGILVNNKAGGAGIILHNQTTVTGSASGFYGLQSSTTRPFARWQQEAGSAKGTLLQLISSAYTKANHLIEIQHQNARPLAWLDGSGQYHLEENTYGQQVQTLADANGVRLRMFARANTSGTGPWWPAELAQVQEKVYLRGASTAATDRTLDPTFNKTFMTMDTFTGNISFFNGTAPVARQAVPVAATDAATTQALANSLRTALINLGLCY